MRPYQDHPDGQTSLDFLIGITIFLLAFIFVFAFIPKMFTPFVSNSDQLTMAADRAAEALVESVLIDTTHTDQDFAGGFPAIPDGAARPGIINGAKYLQLQDHISAADPVGHYYSPGDVIQMKKTLGLGYGKSVSTAAEDFYHFNITLSKYDPAHPQVPVDDKISPDRYPSGANVGQSKRFVLLFDPTAAGDKYTMAVLTVRVW